ncbi:hypothetical protein [Burkholderia gladioli]|uniref:hypothetical protein n=1 Tax=Burkholderia gladioli TaxID=28095 RepID=UPI001640332E|nr:hypothetical protein [Burkholderia gladioli]
MKHETKGHAYAAIGRVVRHTTTGDLAEVTGFYGDTHRFIRSLGGRTPHVVPLDEIEAAPSPGDAVRTKVGSPWHPVSGVVDRVFSDGFVRVLDEHHRQWRLPIGGVEFDPYRVVQEIFAQTALEVSRETKSHVKHDKSTAYRSVAMVAAVALFPVMLVAGRWIRRIGQ